MERELPSETRSSSERLRPYMEPKGAVRYMKACLEASEKIGYQMGLGIGRLRPCTVVKIKPSVLDFSSEMSSSLLSPPGTQSVGFRTIVLRVFRASA